MKQLLFLLLFTILISCDEDTIESVSFGVIEGQVVDEITDEPIFEAKVETRPSSEVVLTDVNGNFTLQNVPSESVTIEVQKDDYLTAFEGVNVVSGQISNVLIEMESENFNNQLPNPPILLSPQNGESNVSQNPLLSWSKPFDNEGDTLTYTLYYFQEGSTTVTEVGEIADTTFNLQALELNRTYYWQVGASDDFHNQEAISEIFSFQTTFFSDNNILYTKFLNGNPVIFSTQEGATQEVQLTDSGQSSYRPRKNPVTNEIAFLREIDNETHLFTMNVDGSNVQQVSNLSLNGFDSREIDFTWSNSGDRLIYPSFSKLISVNKDGSGTEIIYETATGLFITEVVQSFSNGNYILKLNDPDGYNAEIIEITSGGEFIQTLIDGLEGAVGGLDLSFDGRNLLYTHDISGVENNNYRQLNTHIFILDLIDQNIIDLSLFKPAGTLDLDPRFSPEEVEVIYTNRSNVIGSTPSIYKIPTTNITTSSSVLITDNASMGDWE